MIRTFDFASIIRALRFVGRHLTKRPQAHLIFSSFAGAVCRNFGKALSVMLIVSLLATSTPAAPQTIVALTKEYTVSLAFWFNASGWRKAASRLIQGHWPRAPRQEKQEERNARISRIQIYPDKVTLDLGQHVFFSAIAYDSENTPVSGATIKWSGKDSGSGRRIALSPQGEFEATRAGSFRVVAEVRGQTAEVNVVVRPGARRNLDEVPLRKRHVSSRDLPKKASSATKPDNSSEIAAKNSKRNRGEAKRQSSRLRAHTSRSSSRSSASAAPALLPDVGWGDDNYWSAGEPGNTVGDPPGNPIDGGAGSGNFQFAAPVLDLPGRGIDVALSLAYNSRLWNKAGNQISYDNDRGWPAPGFSLGFGKVMGMGVMNGGMIVDADGTRHSYSGDVTVFNWGTTFVGRTTDGTFIDYSYTSGVGGPIIFAQAKLPNGTVITYSAPGPGAVYPTHIADANGNFISITYVNNTGPQIQTITDTLNRQISFHYNENNLLTAVEGPGYDNSLRTLVRLHYRQLSLNYSFAWPLTASVRDANPWVLDAIYYPGTGNGYWFGDLSNSYSEYGMLAKVSERRNMTFSNSPLTENGTVTSAGDMTRDETYNYPLTISDPGGSGLTDAPTYSTATEKWTRDGVNTDEAVTHYSAPTPATGQPRIMTITFPNGTKSVQYSHNAPGSFLDGLVYQDQTLDSSDHVLQSSSVTWEQGAYSSPRPIRVEAVKGSLPMTATEFSYGSVYNQVVETRNFDYGGTSLLNSTVTQYQNSPNYTNRHIFNLPLTVQTYASDGYTRVSRVDYQYDGPGSTLQNAPGVVMHSAASDPYTTATVYGNQCCLWAWDEWGRYCEEFCEVNAYQPATDYRGNVTQMTTYATAGTEPAGGPVTTTYKYDITGNLVVSSSACCEQTSFGYTINTQYAFPESGTRGSATDPYAQITTSATYDFNTGLTKSTKDENGLLSEINYFPNSLRPMTYSLPTGAHTDFTYNDSLMTITEATYLEGHPTHTTTAMETVKLLNGRGQLRQEKSLGATGVYDIVDTEFNSMGQVSRQSRPHRSETPQWINFSYDALGRTTKIIGADYTLPDLSDGSTTERFYDEETRPSVASTSFGETARIRDAWGRERWARNDSQGRLVEVVEPNPNGSGSVFEAGALVTTYAYDTLGNLVNTSQNVPGTQETQTRSFKYDSLSRLVAQKLAEMDATLDDAGTYHATGGTWSNVYTYDERSNVTSQTDARGVKAVFNYNNDPLNRLQSVSWDTSGFGDSANPIVAAATVSYQYRTKSTGAELRNVTQIAGITTAGISTEIYDFDSESRLNKKTLTLTARTDFPFVTDYTYDALDRPTDITYPKEYGNGTTQPRKVIHQSYDVASRLAGLTVDGASHASNFVYNAASQATSLKVGLSGNNQITENYSYESTTGFLSGQSLVRGTDTTHPILDLSYQYTNSNNRRTGQLTKILNNKDHNKDRGYAYDALGRLKVATGGPSGTFWTQTYSYDRFGNRTSVSSSGHSASLRERDNPIFKTGVPALADAVAPGTGVSKPTSAQPDPASRAAEATAPPTTQRSSSASSDSQPNEQLVAEAGGPDTDDKNAPRATVRSHHASRSTRTTPTAPQGGSPTFTDDPLNQPSPTTIQALHITELRSWIDQLRIRAGLAAASWQQPVGVGSLVIAAAVQELRTKLDEALLALQLATGGYSAGLAENLPILAVHIQELRDRVKAAWVSSSTISNDGLAAVSYQNSSNRITTAGFEYDKAGNQVRALAASGGAQRFQYDAANRLVKVSSDNNQIVLASYTYGDSNERLVVEEGSSRTYYTCGGGAEYTESVGSTSPQWSKTYIYLGGRLLSTLTPNGSGGEFVQYHHPDRLGTRLVTNGQDNSYFEQVTLPFGTALGAESTGSTNRRFTSYDRSTATGLDYALNRHYDPRQGRFTQVDPIGMGSVSLESPQTLNLYAYCANDPINHLDPSGLGFFSFLKKIFGKIVRALKAALKAFVVAFVSSGGNFRTARRAAVRAFVSDLGFRTRTWNTPQWNPNAVPILGNGTGALSRYIIWNLQDPGDDPDVIRSWILEPGDKLLALMNKIRKALCKAVPRGRVSGVQGTGGILGGPTGGVELVQNYRSGQVSGFAFGGAQAGWNGGASANISSGFVWGLNDSNTNYSGGFSGVNGSGRVGVNVQSSSGGLTGGARELIPNPREVTSVTLTAGVSLIPTPTGGATVTHATRPLQMGRWWAQASNMNMIDGSLIAANQACR